MMSEVERAKTIEALGKLGLGTIALCGLIWYSHMITTSSMELQKDTINKLHAVLEKTSETQEEANELSAAFIESEAKRVEINRQRLEEVKRLANALEKLGKGN